MSEYVLGFHDVDPSHRAVVGGKGANLAELSSIEGIRVPEGFCVTTAAYDRLVAEAPSLDALLDRLSRLAVEDRKAIGALAEEIRRVIVGWPLPPDLEEAIGHPLATLGEAAAYAVRSSATAEDSPTASFAGQHDTFLNVVGPPAVLARISQCWASLFTERAVAYRLQQGLDHRQVCMAVIVQRMVFPEAAGVMFTADPVSGHRRVVAIDATLGLGDALVSGQVNADHYRVRDGRGVEARIAAEHQHRPTLTNEQALALARLGHMVEAHFGQPQDIEWCLAGDQFQLVQTRPITTLFPIPGGKDSGSHLYLSVGHQQMMTDPMKPLGLAVFQLTSLRPMVQAGGRLFVDIAQQLASPDSLAFLLKIMAQHEPLTYDAITNLLARGDFVAALPPAAEEPALAQRMFMAAQPDIENDPAVVTGLIAKSRDAIATLDHDIGEKSGPALFDFILADLGRLKKSLIDPQNMGAILAAMNAAAWINEHMQAWLGETNAADTLSQSVPHNITSKMGLDLLDVADVVRPHPEVIAYLRAARDEDFLDGLTGLPGGRESRAALQGYLEAYGMRGVGEIDLTRPRWIEQPTSLVSMILGNVEHFEPGAARRKFEQGRQEALDKEKDLLERLRRLPDGEQKATETQQKISLLRNFVGYREYPKYDLINAYFIYKRALLRQADRLVEAGVVQAREDVFYLTFDEFREVVRTQHLDAELIRRRKEEHRSFERLTPPRVMTSEGEVLRGAYRRDHLPPDALIGLPVSAGVIEGRARVLSHIEEAQLEEGDILVTTFTDPSWTPLFVSIKGLVTEVGGLMTHGAVIAREYGLPGVVGVEGATRSIRDGQRIRVNGTEGYVEILGE